MKNQAQWTFMVYLAGDNNLSVAGEKDLGEMRSVGSTADVNVVAEFDRAGDTRETRRYRIERDGVNERIVSLGETDCGDPTVLLNFIHWAVNEYPAERYALVLWNHGSGWEPSEMDRVARSVRAVDYNGRELAERSSSPLRRVLFRSTLERVFSLPTASDRAICSDDGSGHSLDTVELGDVLRKATETLGQPFDLLGMDACLMSNLEVAYQVRPYVRYVVGSEEVEPNDGWPYHLVLRRLVEEPSLTTSTLAAHIVDAYIASYAECNYKSPVTQSAVDTSRVEDLAASLDNLTDALIVHMPDAAMEIWQAQRRSARFYHNTLWDIAHFCEAIERISSDEAVRRTAQAVRATLEPAPGAFIIAEGHRGEKMARCGGMSIYLQPPLSSVSRFYGDLGYARDHRWPVLLRAYHKA